MKQRSIGYELIRFYVKFAYWLTHKKIVVTGKHLIPKGKPIIFAPNHQNALMDPLALICTNPNQTVWLARADIFKSKIAEPILKYLKLLPIYRIRDGKDNLTNNEQIFSQVIDILEKGQTIALFPEAAHSAKNQMLPHKKAIPRIAFDAEEKNDFMLGLQIVPVGIFYSHYWAFNRTVIIQYGEPIDVDRYKAKYEENQQTAMLSLRDKIYEKIYPLTLQIRSKANYQLYEDLRKMAGEVWSQTYFFSKNKPLQLYYAEKGLIEHLEETESKYPEPFAKIETKYREYFSSLKRKRVNEEQLRQAKNARWKKLPMQFMAVLLSFPLFILGFIFNVVPFLIPQLVFRRMVKDIAFLSTFHFVSGLIIFPLFYFAESYLVYVLTGSSTIALIGFILMPFTGKYAYQLFEFYRNFVHQLSYLLSFGDKRKRIDELLNLRNELIELATAKQN
ncbi:MAG: 1-acyl-sn-glycerol-3-phosphate acyltransferase [Prolixibacteraceae bacterium]|jgi:1-acyl-sn-glycerol-3-phosphate acyltransferase